jgi:hypothetical protein
VAKLDDSEDEGEIWYRCDECGAEQEEDGPCVDCKAFALVPFIKPYPPKLESNAHITLRAKIQAALRGDNLEGQLDSLITMLSTLTNEERRIFLAAMHSGLLAVGISIDAAMISIRAFSDELRKSQVSMHQAMENVRKGMKGISEV